MYRFADYHFDELAFPILVGEIKHLEKQAVQKIIHLQSLANQLRDTFTDSKGVATSYILAANGVIGIDVHVEHSFAEESKARLKRGRPLNPKDKIPRKRKEANIQDDQIEVKMTTEESLDISNIFVLEEPQVLEISENYEISINYGVDGLQCNRNKVNVDHIFAYNVALVVMNDNEDHESLLMNVDVEMTGQSGKMQLMQN